VHSTSVKYVNTLLGLRLKAAGTFQVIWRSAHICTYMYVLTIGMYVQHSVFAVTYPVNATISAAPFNHTCDPLRSRDSMHARLCRNVWNDLPIDNAGLCCCSGHDGQDPTAFAHRCKARLTSYYSRQINQQSLSSTSRKTRKE
jgi:hypothetical protein